MNIPPRGQTLLRPRGTKIEPVGFAAPLKNDIVGIDAADLIPLDSPPLPHNLVVDNRSLVGHIGIVASLGKLVRQVEHRHNQHLAHWSWLIDDVEQFAIDPGCCLSWQQFIAFVAQVEPLEH